MDLHLQRRVATSINKYLVLCIGDIAQLVERWNDDSEIAGSNPLYATIFLPTMFACWHTPLQMETHHKND